MTLYISDQAEEFRIEISGRFADASVGNAATAWKAALLENTPRRISVDITRMTGYDHAGLVLLREVHLHGTHIVAGTPRSLLFFNQISSPPRPVSKLFSDEDLRRARRASTKQILTMPSRAGASGE
jgi:hypothetical protein